MYSSQENKLFDEVLAVTTAKLMDPADQYQVAVESKALDHSDPRRVIRQLVIVLTSAIIASIGVKWATNLQPNILAILIMATIVISLLVVCSFITKDVHKNNRLNKELYDQLRFINTAKHVTDIGQPLNQNVVALAKYHYRRHGHRADWHYIFIDQNQASIGKGLRNNS